MSQWKLYWVASDGIEDCFVVAKNSRSAKKIEKDTNGFEDDDLSVMRVMDIPDKYEKEANKRFRTWSIKNNCNQHLTIEELTAWPYYADDWLLKKLGAEMRNINGERQVLIDDTVFAPSGVYPIGKKAIKELYELEHEEEFDISNMSYDGIGDAIEIMLGKSISMIHEIENDITNSFIFGVGNKKYKDYTISEVMKLWKRKLTFGKLIKLMEEKFEIHPDVKNALQLFLEQRNKIAHGLTKDERYDIDTFWGQKETVAYLALFLRNAASLKIITTAAYIVSTSLGYYLMEQNHEISNRKIKADIEKFQSDPYIMEQLSIFTEVFQLKSSMDPIKASS